MIQNSSKRWAKKKRKASLSRESGFFRTTTQGHGEIGTCGLSIKKIARVMMSIDESGGNPLRPLLVVPTKLLREGKLKFKKVETEGRPSRSGPAPIRIHYKLPQDKREELESLCRMF